ncbi:MAG: endopeptidase La [Oscillospiraceae bacterium]|jgi:ATP-dependent Lon protease|nr:endopeptidase La [Oscillospiraceae bacterium]
MTKHLSIIPVKDFVIFPHMSAYIDIVNETLIKQINNSFKNGEEVFITMLSEYEDESEEDSFCKTGTVSLIKQIIKLSDEKIRVLFEGVSVANLLKTEENSVEVEIIEPDDKNTQKEAVDLSKKTILAAQVRSLKSTFNSFANFFPQLTEEYKKSVIRQKNPYKLFELIAFNIPVEPYYMQNLLEERDIFKKINILYKYIFSELETRMLEMHIHQETIQQLEERQREIFLKTKLEVIKRQISSSAEGNVTYTGYGEDIDIDIENTLNEFEVYRMKIENLPVEQNYKDKLFSQLRDLKRMPINHPDSSTLRTYLDTVFELPWGVFSKNNNNIDKAEKILSKDHYGMDKVKERVLETIAVHLLKPDITGQIICLVGPPGTGKTSIGKSLAKACGREYARVALGGVRDESEIRGHRKTYVASMPGRIMDAVRLAKTSNPLLLLDEIDKLGNDHRGDPAAALLEALDPEQNKAFRDHYIEIPYDLSKVLFVTTANSLDTIPKPLLDRMEVIELRSYTREEKFHIAKEHLLSKQISRNGLKKSDIAVKDDAIYSIIDNYTREAGVRNLERKLASLCRKAAKEIVSSENFPDGKRKKVIINKKNIEDFLGNKKYLPDEISLKNEVGLTNGLAWTAVGGTLLPLEVGVYNGRGNIKITGSLGKVMEESANIAVSYVRSIADKYGIEDNFNRKKDIHIHAPEGATPKDGPSAGVTMVTSLVSALSGIPVRGDVAMTGEITLHGKVLPIGGLREKTMAAYKEKMKTVIIPYGNKGDLYECENVVKENLEFIFAKNISDVLDVALVKNGVK